MNCATTRLRLLRGTDPEAELHLESCAACFEWLEMNDRTTGLLMASRPDLAPGPGFAARVIARWAGRRRAFVRAGSLAAASLLVAAAAVVAIAAASGDRLAGIAAGFTPLESLLDVPRALLLENVPNLVALAVAAAALSLVAAGIYRQLGAGPRRLAR